MRKSLFLYLFIIAVLMNVFTYKYFSMKEMSESKTDKGSNVRLKDSIAALNDKMYEADYFSLEHNDRAQNYLDKGDINAFSEKVKQALMAYNDDREGNKYTGQIKMGDQKYVINKIKLLNHRWIIADYSNGELWGEVLLKYFENEDKSISFEIVDTYLYSKSLN